MKIVLVTPRLDLGGSQRYITELANHWAKSKHEVTIISLRKDDNFYTISDQITVINLNYSQSGKLNKIFRGFKTMLKLRRNIKQINPSFVLSVLSTTNILTISSTFFLKPKIFIRDAFGPKRKRKKVERILRKFLYKKANGIIAQTEEIKEFTKKETGSKNIKVIVNPVREFDFSEGYCKEKIILNVGRLHPYKGQKYFIEVCAKIKKPDWEFAILGEGELRETLESQIKNLSIGNKITLAGAVKNVDKWLLKSSIFVLTSLQEGLPNSLIEAMAAGLPCISFDFESSRDLIIDGENGFIVSIGNVDLLKLKIEELIDNPRLRHKLSIEAVKTVDKFKVNAIANEVLDFCTNS